MNHEPHLILVTPFLVAVLLPFLILEGFMLPLVYSLLPKDAAGHGKKCGWRHFYNALGTATGAILLSHLLLIVLDLDQVFKIDIAILAGLTVVMLYRERPVRAAAAVLVVAALFVAGPRWDRSSHQVGLFAYQGLHDFRVQGCSASRIRRPKPVLRRRARRHGDRRGPPAKSPLRRRPASVVVQKLLVPRGNPPVS